MERLIFPENGIANMANLFLADLAAKGTALLVLAAFTALFLRRDSAATRHLIWLLGMIALLALPVLSILLPQWRVLPDWTSNPATPTAAVISPPLARPDLTKREINGAPETLDLPQPTPNLFQSKPIISQDDPVTENPPPIAQPQNGIIPWNLVLPLIWVAGFSVLILRLVAARLVLWTMEQKANRLWSTTQKSKPENDSIINAMETAIHQLGMHRPAILLSYPEKTVPLVWGILSSRLLLPIEARQWKTEQLRSVLLHELAHINRYDTLAQLFTQLACALHWFNPLVWFAAWRLGVEREHACDDLVLANGVRPSAYAGHLLDVVTGLSTDRGIPTGGLAMARKSSLEGRLVAVLSKNLNRRGVSLAIASVALVVALGVSVPIAMLRSAEANRVPSGEGVAEISPEPKEIFQGGPSPEGSQPETSPKPSNGTKLKPTTEQLLKWGEPINGLRMALAWPPSLGEPGLGNAKEFQLVLQNISPKQIRLTANDQFPNPRRMMFRKNGSPLSAIADPTVMKGDWLLNPGEVAFLRLFREIEKLPDGRTIGELNEESVRVFPQYSLTAEMTIEKAPPGSWTGKLNTGQTRGSMDVILPKDKEAQDLYATWTTAARTDGKIPAGVIAKLGDSVKTFIKNNPTWPTTPQLQTMLPRFEATRDFSGKEAIALLDELATLQNTPIGMALESEKSLQIRTGTLLPEELSKAPWGEALPNGLRLAWLLEPNAAAYPLGTSLKARVLIHNSGKIPVVFRTRTWHQVNHTAKDANGTEIKAESTYWTTIGRLNPYRLAPGEFIEVNAPGIGVGANKKEDDWQNIRVGTWLDVKPGDDATVLTNPVPLSDWNEKFEMDGIPGWWLDHIKSRLQRHLPFPPGKEARERLLYRIAMELFGTPVSMETNEAFVADKSPTALDSLAERLFHRPGLNSWSGSLVSGPTKFRVLPPDPNTAKKPRIITGPGGYTLGENSRLFISRRPENERLINEARIEFFSRDPKIPSPGKPREIPLPDGYNTWSAAWTKSSTTLWVRQKDSTRSYDFSNPAEIKETVFNSPESLAKIPKDIHEALGTITNGPERPKAPPAATGR